MGKKICKSEIAQYHPDVLVQWQKKAWYDSNTCNKWAALACIEFIKKEEGPHLILCDNLSGQTTEEFKKVLKKHGDATVHNLLAGCTDDIQVVDAGFGALIKRHKEEVESEWLEDDGNWQRWSGGRLSASERRVLMTLWYGEAYERACHSYDFEKVFTKVGSNLTADGSRDDLIKLQGLDVFTFSDKDAERDAKTGEFNTQQLEDNTLQPEVDTDDEAEIYSDDEPVGAAAEGASAERAAVEGADEEGSDPSEGSDSSDEDVGEYEAEAGWEVVSEYNFSKPTDLVGTHFAYKFCSGWDRGRVTGIEKNRSSPDYGMFIVKFASEESKRCLALEKEDYDIDDIWVSVKRKPKSK